MAFIQVLEQLIIQIPNSKKYIIMRKEFVLLSAATYKILPFKDIIKLYPELKRQKIVTKVYKNRIQLYLIKHQHKLLFSMFNHLKESIKKINTNVSLKD